ncbi:DoxX family protein [Amycolatopsis benzoatilytica]|uniref:DoxX family protein n=1 Tax=Amycolatopsis benzoatilytica TaxID=346045 RepID=UPI00035E10AA|nr:membrane protein [Amycolatopsis benzoatilytica]
MSEPRASQRPAYFLAALLAGAGALHFARPKPFDALVPEELPGDRRAWTYASGVAELGVAAGIALPRTRRLGGLAAALLFVGVFPGNVKMALDYQRRGRPARERTVAWLRLPMQWPLVNWALTVRERA